MLRLSSKRDFNADYKSTMRLLDDSEILECEFKSYHKGKYLLDFVFSKLNLIETDYFGLRFVDENKHRHWLDPNKNVLKQIKVKFYPADPSRLQEEVSRYQLFLQLRRDLLHGRLYCSQSDAACLGAYIIQADLGDYNVEGNYAADYKLFLKQTPKLEEKIIEVYKTLNGLVSSLAEIQFLKKAASLDTYGIDPYSVKDHKGNQLFLGINPSGIITFQGSHKTHHFRWQDIQKLNYEGRMFIVHLIFYEDARTRKKRTVGFKCPTSYVCRHLWRCSVEQRLFFTLQSSNKHGVVVTGGSFFSRGSRFRYLGRCEKEVVEDSAGIMREPPSVNRMSRRNLGKSSSLPVTPGDSDNYNSLLSRTHRPLPYVDRSCSLDEEVLCGRESPFPEESLNDLNSGTSAAYCPETTLPPLNLLEPLLETREYKTCMSPSNCILNECDSSSLYSNAAGEDHISTYNIKEFEVGESSSSEGFDTPYNANRGRPKTFEELWPPHNSDSLFWHLKPSKKVLTKFMPSCIGLKKFINIFLFTFFCIVFMLIIFVILLFESSPLCLSSLWASQEMLLLRIQYYEPLKNGIKTWLVRS